MRTALSSITRTTFLLLTLGISVHAQPVIITEIPKASTNFVSAGGLVYFTSRDSLLRSNGTAEGTVLLTSGLSAGFSQLTEFNNLVVFVSGSELWRSDGTPAGTTRLIVKNGIGILPSINSQLFFHAGDASTGSELYKTDGTSAGTMLIEDINPGAGDGFLGNAAVAGQYLFFRGSDGSSGAELWRSNGTAAGTLVVKDVNPGSGDGFVETYFYTDVYGYNSRFYFVGYTPANGREPWVSDGTAAGTFMLKDVIPGAADPFSIIYGIGHNGIVYLITRPDPATSDPTATLWKTTGATNSMVPLSLLIKDYNDFGGVTYADPFRIYRGKVYFFGHYEGEGPHELWVTDATPAGTHKVAMIDNERSEPTFEFFDVVNDYMLFYGRADGNPGQLFRSDGTEAGTRGLAYFNSAAHWAESTKLTKVGDLLFYPDHDGPTNEGGGAIDPNDYFHLFQHDAEKGISMRTLYGISTAGSRDVIDYDGKVVFSTLNDHTVSTDKQKYLWIYDPNSSENEKVGKIQQEVWTGVPGSKVSLIPVDDPPSSVADLALFETPLNLGDNYGARVRGYVRVPQTGNYTFWIASDDQSQLWLSTDDDPGNKRKIAEVTGWTNVRQWDKYSSQRSTRISLVANQKYYIEALLKEGTGRDHLAVGWSLPDGTLEQPIQAKRLIPFIPTQDNICAGAGMIRQEFWTGIPGTRVSAIPVDTTPDFINDLTIFEGPASSLADNYGTRIRGYICAPASGQYTFWIAGDDQTELWLSTDDDAAHKIRIAYHTGWTNRREWTKYTTQQSVPITLSANHRYYVEALMKEGTGSDHVSVGWRLPDGSLERPIAGAHLIPFGNTEPVCNATGTILVETWTGIDGTRVSSIPVDSPPNSTYESLIFQTASNVGNNFGSRYRGYICIPVTGNYTFWIASDDHSELWLSTDADPGNMKRIAYVWGWTFPREWTKYITQQSSPIRLVAGQQYYVEALYKEDEGDDHMAVGWQLPDGTMERPMYANHLSPFRVAAPVSNTARPTDQELYSRISVYPNPIKGGDRQLTISGYEDIEQVIETDVEILDMRGELVFADRILCGGNCSSYLIHVNKPLVPGIYVLRIRTDIFRSSKMLLVK